MSTAIFQIAAACWLIVLGTVATTENFQSALVFKIAPNLFGFGLLLIGGGKLMGWPLP